MNAIASFLLYCLHYRFVAKALVVTLALMISSSHAQERKNSYNDPFEQVTNAMTRCPVPEEPSVTMAEMRSEAHYRGERGTRCYASGRCRLPNAYMYDKEIIPRVKKIILHEGKFNNTSVWIEGQRRWVYLRGCVNTKQQSRELERAVRSVDDVESVINELMIGVTGKPPYRSTSTSASK